MISPSGQFLGAFVTLTQGLAATKFDVNPTGMVIPGPEDQQFLRGLIAGSGITTTGGTFAALFFNSNAYSPGQVISNGTLPKGVTPTGNTSGNDRRSDRGERRLHLAGVFGLHRFRHAGRGRHSRSSGASGVQGSNGELLIGSVSTASTPTADQTGAVSSEIRRFEDIAFDQYGYFSQNVQLTTTNTTNTTTGSTTVAFTVTNPPVAAGSVFVTDLGTGLSVTVTSVAEGRYPCRRHRGGSGPGAGTGGNRQAESQPALRPG